MKVETVPIAGLRTDPDNARRHSERNLEAIRSSMERFHQQRPILVGADNLVVAGNGTLAVALALGWTEIEIVRTELSGAEARAYAIADNRTAELADWDLGALAAGLTALDEEGISAGLLGFTSEELAEMLDPGVVPGDADPDEIPPPPDKATTRREDLITLGDHRLLCGDSAAAADVARLMGGNLAHLINTDPPYNVATEPASEGADTGGEPSWRSSAHKLTRPHHRKGMPRIRITHPPSRSVAQSTAKGRRMANDLMSDEKYEATCGFWFENMAGALLPGRSFYVWGGAYPGHAGTRANSEVFPQAMRRHGMRYSQMIVWDKGSGVINRKDMMSQYEVCFYGWKEGAAHAWLGAGNVTDIWPVAKVTQRAMVHLTEKPVELAVRAMQYSSRTGEHVLDLFGGSGSTLIAAQQTGRRAFLMEIDPLYCDVIVTRYEQFTGRKADRCEHGGSDDKRETGARAGQT